MHGEKLIYILLVQKRSPRKYANKIAKLCDRLIKQAKQSLTYKEFGERYLETVRANWSDTIEEQYARPWELNDIFGFIYLYYDGGARFVADWYFGTTPRGTHRRYKVNKNLKKMIFKGVVIARPEIPLSRKELKNNKHLREQFVELLKETQKSVKIWGLFCNIDHAKFIADNLDFVRIIKNKSRIKRTISI
ncbi:hypothetical protein ACFL4J_00970 [Candidatus Margulisiibacteriota bacterium]